ncbi:MAG TPA: hypothetical protein VFG84_07225 [Gemmatimonadaceae bacterium]|nr:hypothetical protein [Gemmatimonadaceae bacterium]
MKKLLVLMFALAACSSSQSGPSPSPSPDASGGSSMTGATSSRGAVEQFLAAVRARDLQAISVIWGTEKGPARDQLERTELEKREIIMQDCLVHDQFRILDETTGEGGQRVFRVELTKGAVSATPRFYTVLGPENRWYVLEAEINAARALCNLP